MQPTPELTVKVKDEALADWCEKQGVPVPRVRVRMALKHSQEFASSISLGSYQPDEQIINLNVLSSALATAEGQRLLYVVRTLNHTFLHELRHHWQFSTWSAEKLARAFEGPYARRPGEVDANEFADAFNTTLTLITVKRSFGGGRISGFGRLAAAQEGVRR